MKNYHVVIGDKVDEAWIDAIRVVKAFKTAHIGLIGYRAHGFFNLDVDELDLYRQIGILLDHYELIDIFNTEVDRKAVTARQQQIPQIFNLSGITHQQIEKVALLTEKFDTFLRKNGLSAVAVRCCPNLQYIWNLPMRCNVIIAS